MQRYNNVPKQKNHEILRQFSASQRHRRLPWLTTITVLTLVTLACGFFGTSSRSGVGRVAVLTRLPTLTRTPLPTLVLAEASTPTEVVIAGESIDATITSNVLPTSTTETLAAVVAEDLNPASSALTSMEATSTNQPVMYQTETSTNSPSASPTQIPTPTSTSSAAPTVTPFPTNTPTATATETPLPADTPTTTPIPPPAWVFSGMRLDQSQGNLLLYGDLINNTDVPQSLALISGTFYDAQGQPITEASTFDYWIIETIRPGGRVPFELTIFGPQSVANYDLIVDAGLGNNNEIPREDFEFLDVNQSSETGEYCVTGRVQNPGDSLQSYLATAIILYDGQDHVINFSDGYQDSPTGLMGDQTLNVDLCVDPLGQAVSRYELRAWGL